MRIRQGRLRGRRGAALAGSISAAVLLAFPAAASAWQVTVHVHGGGRVVETTARALMDCTTPIGAAESDVTDCVAGTPGGFYNSFDVVNLRASVPTEHANRGWRFLKWVDSSAAGKINCDPQDTTGDHTAVDCQFQTFENLEVDLYFDDIAGPQTSITTSQPSTTNATAASFDFDSDDPNANYECRLDRPGQPGSFAACGTPLDKSESYSGLTANGTYTFQVRGVDPSGNVDPTPASRTWTVDTVPPVPSISGGPGNGSFTSSTGASFGISANEPSTLACKLDGGSFSACSSPKSYTALGDGAHTFTLRATDLAGNTATASRTWTVDTVAPTPTIGGGPAHGSLTSQTGASFDVGSSEGGATLACELDSGTAAPCTDPQQYADLSDGEHTFTLTATDAAGNSDSASRTWTVDTIAPGTAITAGPSGETDDPSPQFGFSSEAGADFQCRIDPEGPGGWEACSSPKSYPALANGPHVFEVRARDGAGNVDPTPARRPFTVVAPDADGDDVPDAADACESLAGQAANGCPDIARELSLSFKRKRKSLKGTLFANAPACIADRTVQLFRIKRGPDDQAGEATTGSTGKYKIKVARAKGKYRTKVAAETVATAGNCLAATSPKVRVKPKR